MLGQLGGAGAGRGVDEVELDKAAQGAVFFQNRLVAAAVVLVALEAGAQGRNQHGVAEGHLDPGAHALEVAAVVLHHPGQGIQAKNLVFVGIKGTDDPAHVDALEVGLKRYRAGNTGLEGQGFTRGGGKLEREPEARDAHLLDGDVGPFDRVHGLGHVGQAGLVGRIGPELVVVVAGDDGFGAVGVAEQVGFFATVFFDFERGCIEDLLIFVAKQGRLLFRQQPRAV